MPSVGTQRLPVLEVGTRSNRLLRFGMAAALVLVCGFTTLGLLQKHSWGLDLSIIADASQRWLDGADPYVRATGPETNYAPFLQPPFFLPVAAPLTIVPRTLAHLLWTLLLIGCAGAALRRLDVPLLLIPVFLIWPPFMEGLYFGNVQVLSFAAFAFLLWRASATQPALRPRPLDLASSDRPAAIEGLLAISIILLKVTQVFPWIHLLGRRPIAAVLGATLAACAIAVTVLFTGASAWIAWLDQLMAASSDPSIGWTYSLIAPLGTVAEVLAIGAASLVAFLVKGPRAGLVVGILLVVASPSLRMHGLEYLLPAMFFIRREIALVAALLISLYFGPIVWLGIALVVVTTLAAVRFPVLRERAGPTTDPRVASTSVRSVSGVEAKP